MKDTRLVKQVYEEQKRLNLVDCLYNTIMEDLESLKIYLRERQIGKLQTKEWKSLINKKIIESIEIELCQNYKTKMRFITITLFGLKSYEGAKLLKLKLNMTELKTNYKGKHENALCRRCGPIRYRVH